MDAPRIRHAQADGASIAYQTLGEGRRTIVMVPPFAHNIELIWEQSDAAEFFERLGAMGRVVHFDKRGCGRSDRRLPPASLEDRIADLHAVLNAERIERAVIIGTSEGGSLATFFAATYPERIEALILKGAYAAFARTDDHPGLPTTWMRKIQVSLGRPLWGRGFFYSRYMAPSMRRQTGFRGWAARFERGSLAGSNMPRWAMMNSTLDIRGVLGAIQTPTLVTHSSNDRLIPIATGHYPAEKITNAEFIELPGADHVPFFAARGSFLDALEDFIGTPERSVPKRGRSLQPSCSRTSSDRRTLPPRPAISVGSSYWTATTRSFAAALTQ